MATSDVEMVEIWLDEVDFIHLGGKCSLAAGETFTVVCVTVSARSSNKFSKVIFYKMYINKKKL